MKTPNELIHEGLTRKDIKPNVSPDKNLNDAIDTTVLCFSIMNDLATMFVAIKNSTDDQHTKELAKIGQYLADDWSNTFDCAREDLERRAGIYKPRGTEVLN